MPRKTRRTSNPLESMIREGMRRHDEIKALRDAPPESWRPVDFEAKPEPVAPADPWD